MGCHTLHRDCDYPDTWYGTKPGGGRLSDQVPIAEQCDYCIERAMWEIRYLWGVPAWEEMELCPSCARGVIDEQEEAEREEAV